MIKFVAVKLLLFNSIDGLLLPTDNGSPSQFIRFYSAVLLPYSNVIYQPQVIFLLMELHESNCYGSF